MRQEGSIGALSMSLLLVAVLIPLAGCGKTAPSRFYALSPAGASDARAVPENRSLTVGVTYVKMPDYLDRPQIATRIGPNELRFDDFNRWAEPLKENFSRVLAENLSVLLGTDKVIISTRGGVFSVDYQVWVEVTQFDANAAGDVSLVAKWSVLQPEEKKPLITKRSTFSEPAAAPGYEAMVAAGSRAVADLSREIAEALRKVSAK